MYKRKFIFVLIAFNILIFGMNTVVSFGASQENGFSKGSIGVLMASANGVNCIPSISINPTTTYEDKSVKISIGKGSVTNSFVGRSTTKNRTAIYTYYEIDYITIFSNSKIYNNSNATIAFPNHGTYLNYAKVTYAWKTTKDKVSAGWPEYFYKTFYTAKKSVIVKINTSPNIISTYTTISDKIISSSLYNNTNNIKFCANIKDIDGDAISLNSSSVKLNGSAQYDSYNYILFSSISGIEKTRGEYNKLKRGVWSLTWTASDGRLKDIASYTKTIKNRVPVITSAYVSPSNATTDDSIEFRATSIDSDGDKIYALRFYVTNSSNVRIYPSSSSYKTIASSYPGGSQKSICCSPETLNLPSGSYKANFYAIDGYDGVSCSNIYSVSFKIKNAESNFKITDTYTTINGVKTSATIYNNTQNIKFCAEIKGIAPIIMSSMIKIDGIKKYEGYTHNGVKSSTPQIRFRGEYDNLNRGIWSLTWTASDGKKEESIKYLTAVKNRLPVIISAEFKPSQLTTKTNMCFYATAIDADKDKIKKITYIIKNKNGNIIRGPITAATNYDGGIKQAVIVPMGELKSGDYIGQWYASDGYNGSVSEVKEISFTVKEVEKIENEQFEIVGNVYHTEYWEKNRKAFNQYYFRDYINYNIPFARYTKIENLPRQRGINVFWSGEKLMLEAKINGQQPTCVEVSILGYSYKTELKNIDGSWKGSLFDPNMIKKWGKCEPELITLLFTGELNSNVVKNEVPIVVDDFVKYWDLHRKE